MRQVYGTKVTRRTLGDLPTCRWIAHGDTVLFLGPPGIGKTHLAVSLGREAIRQDYSVQFVTAATLVAMLAKAHNDGSHDKQLTILSRPKLLIIDELDCGVQRGAAQGKAEGGPPCRARSRP